jgi:hypothetical protein
MYKHKNLHQLSTPEVLLLNPSSLTIRVEHYSQETNDNHNERQGRKKGEAPEVTCLRMFDSLSSLLSRSLAVRPLSSGLGWERSLHL